MHPDEAIRLECLRMAQAAEPDPQEALTLAAAYESFVKGRRDAGHARAAGDAEASVSAQLGFVDGL